MYSSLAQMCLFFLLLTGFNMIVTLINHSNKTAKGTCVCNKTWFYCTEVVTKTALHHKICWQTHKTLLYTHTHTDIQIRLGQSTSLDLSKHSLINVIGNIKHVCGSRQH